MSEYNPPQLTVKPLPPGATDMRTAAIVVNNNTAYKQNDLNNLGVGGSRRKRRRIKGGAASTVTVPVVPVPYKETGAGDNTTAANVKLSTQVGATEFENSTYDNQVGTTGSTPVIKTGGKKKRVTFKGGWPMWGCMSGGTRRRKNHRIRGKRKSRRRRGRKTK